MSLEHILLGMLREPAAGYDLKRGFEEGPRRFWSAELSQIYPTLQRMQRRGWLSSRRRPSAHGPARRVYARTAKGGKALREWLRGGPVIGAERFAYVGQLIFHGELGDSARTLRFLKQLRGKLVALAATMRRDAGPALTAGRPQLLDEYAFHELLGIRFGLRAVRGRIAACDECIALLGARRERRPRRKESTHARTRRPA